MSARKIVVLGTGGTIAGTAASPTDHTGYTAGQIGVGELLDSVPGLAQALKGAQLQSEQLAQLDSKDMDYGTMLRLAQRCHALLQQDDVQSLVVTHGTDTLEETAYLLRLLLEASLHAREKRKAVVFTCAMRPASSNEADGPRNLRDAVALAVDPLASGVLIVCAGDVHHPDFVQKVHSSALNAFSSGDVTLGEAGLMAHVRESTVIWADDFGRVFKQNDGAIHTEYAQIAIKLIATDLGSLINWPRVEVVMNHSNASAALVHALLNHSHPGDPLRGIVVAGTGNGTLAQALQSALVDAQSAGIRVLRASRCPFGGVSPTAHDVLPSTHLSWAKARVLLMLELLGAPQA